MTKASAHYENWPRTMERMKAAAPEIGRGFAAMFQTLMKDGALSVREKELIALGIGLAARCEPCIYAHVEKCVKAGATREQILEAAGVAVVMHGGPAYTHVPEVVDALDSINARAS
jgi:AhpD family alkylhydroperoxidase